MEEIEVRKSYWKNGNIQTKYPCLNRYWHGILYGYYEDGKIDYINRWKNGDPDGLWMHWNNDETRLCIQIRIQDNDGHGPKIDFKY